MKNKKCPQNEVLRAFDGSYYGAAHFSMWDRNLMPRHSLVIVRAEGIEPPRLAALDPKSSTSTSSATPAHFYQIQEGCYCCPSSNWECKGISIF